MKHLCKIVVAVLLLAYALPLSITLAVDYHTTNNENELDIDAKYYAMATVSETDDRYSLPHRDVFINSFPSLESAGQTTSQRGIEVWGNGFSYEDGYFVKTRGQVDVAAVKAVTDYDDFAGRMEQEIAIIERDYPEVTILADPTSKYNCHSYAWCETSIMSERWVPDASLFRSDVHSMVIVDREDAQAGDIVLYYDAPEHIAHSAVIQSVNGAEIICISKWGASVLCSHELEYVPNTYKMNGECAPLIVRRTQHTKSVQATGTGRHTIACTVCSYAITANCAYSYSHLGNDTHRGSCSDCNDTVPNSACSIAIICNANGTHTRACNLCDNRQTISCNLQYTNINNTRHSASCTDCDYFVTSQICSVVYTSRGNKTHTASCIQCQNTYTGSCSITYSYISADQHRGSCNKCDYAHTAACDYMTSYCGNSAVGDVHKSQCQTCGNISGGAATACSFIFKGNGDNTHSQICIQCRYIKSGSAPCMFKSDNTCRFCGAMKDSAVINEQEQEETL